MRAITGCLALLLMLPAASADATSLRVSPVTLDLSKPRSSANLTLRNNASQPVSVQVRVFRWVQIDGADAYEATTDVVASPPAVRLAPQVDYTIRVVRTSKAPLTKEESYRVIIDELPTRRLLRSGTVNLVVRHSIPVFFRDPQGDPPKVTWRLQRTSGQLKLVAENTGGTRLKLADLALNQGSARLYARQGLFGYVLAGAKAEWPVDLRHRPIGSTVTLSAKSQLGRFHENVLLVGR